MPGKANDEPRDEELMSRIQTGDHAAFSMLVRRHTGRFYACAYRMCQEPVTAEDIVQEAFMKLWARPEIWKSATAKKSGAKFTTWFYRVVTNMALDVLRKKKPVLADELLNYTADDRPAQDEEMVVSEEEAALEQAIAKLPERQKAALNLCFYEGVSNKDAAEILDVGLKALESLLMRAKASIKDELIKSGHVEANENKREIKYG